MAPERQKWLDKLKAGLGKTATSISAVFGGTRIDEALYEDLESALLMADAGVAATGYLIADLRKKAKAGGITHPVALKNLLIASLSDLLTPLQKPLVIGQQQPTVIMVAGVNGAGKTTSIGKLAHYFQAQGKSVLLAAGDTFRAAAREQLAAWGERNNVTVIAQASGDAAAVIFDAVNAARARGIDIVLADTAGRLPTQLNLMEEIRKVKRVIDKAMPGAPHEVLLVLDANTGQNALAQLSAFDAAVGVTGLVLTKLDGTAKGGVIAGIALSRAGGKPVPVRFIGVGEGVDDLRPCGADDFVAALLDP
jgi:fused signal recognition particle receptor